MIHKLVISHSKLWNEQRVSNSPNDAKSAPNEAYPVTSTVWWPRFWLSRLSWSPFAPKLWVRTEKKQLLVKAKMKLEAWNLCMVILCMYIMYLWNSCTHMTFSVLVFFPLLVSLASLWFVIVSILLADRRVGQTHDVQVFNTKSHEISWENGIKPLESELSCRIFCHRNKMWRHLWKYKLDSRPTQQRKRLACAGQTGLAGAKMKWLWPMAQIPMDRHFLKICDHVIIMGA